MNGGDAAAVSSRCLEVTGGTKVAADTGVTSGAVEMEMTVLSGFLFW